ncbi:hypothetical protein [Pedobacter sp. SYSU D00535]|uniref:hypothetical protein n=1 Tax=Pedobacter sp. SYSU D00535 TaxID=2810308 RepID=UPI001A961686|nr:hypothetical protein [Pedobacter sp. SYSU D00535]
MKTKKITLLILLFSLINLVSAQEGASSQQSISSEVGVIVGYNYNFSDADSKNYHLAELGIMRSAYSSYRHPVSSSYYFSNEFGLNTERFIWGPKAGGYLSLSLFTIGGEMIYYTNFNRGSLRLAPYFGIGFHRFKLTLNPQIKFNNKELLPNTGSVNIMVTPLALRKKKMR